LVLFLADDMISFNRFLCLWPQC